MVTTTLAQQLQPSAISVQELHSNYSPMLALVRELIGVIPNCDPLLEIWPTGFRTYNLLVPNALNLPFALWGMGAPKAQVGLAMYTASKAASCAYCTAHSCTFALRRGATSEALVGKREPHEAAVAAVAEAISSVPAYLTAAQVVELHRHFSAADVEWLVLAMAMMGFLNKFMDGVGIELEAEPIAEVSTLLTPTGWAVGKHSGAVIKQSAIAIIPPKDNLKTYLRVIRQAPSAILMERKWTKDVPDRWPAVGEYLQGKTGYSFPILNKLTHARVIRAFATILKDNLDPTTTEIGLATKALTGLVYATVVGNDALAQEAQLLATHYLETVDDKTFDAVKRFAQTINVADSSLNQQALEELSALPNVTKQDAAALILARAASTSPAEIGSAVLDDIAPLLSPAGTIELMVWVSVQQIWHRLMNYYTVADTI